MRREQVVFVLFVHGYVQLDSPDCFVAPETRSHSVVDRLSHRAFVAKLGTPRFWIDCNGLDMDQARNYEYCRDRGGGADIGVVLVPKADARVCGQNVF